ncbi:hypothetical protein [Amycolatopsis pittospori]|uniref:hypothetical protein n=1 Tax=Amycolatopsis pittospori TaxID=2749434 RepID=UPI0015EFE2F8|nr:hypothetical protein [Amycolatopsis pittospori]
MRPNTPRRPKAHAAASPIAGVFALLAAGTNVWFALYNVEVANSAERWYGLDWVNVVGGFASALLLLVTAGFTFARKVGGALTLCVLSAFFAVAIFVSPLMRGADVGAHLAFVFGFEKANGIAILLTAAFCLLAAMTSAFAAGMKSA